MRTIEEIKEKLFKVNENDLTSHINSKISYKDYCMLYEFYKLEHPNNMSAYIAKEVIKEKKLKESLVDFGTKSHSLFLGHLPVRSSNYHLTLKELTEDKVKILLKQSKDAMNELNTPTINNYKIQLTEDGNVVSFGCTKFYSPFFPLLANLDHFSPNRNIKSITLDSGVEISIEEIKKVEEYLNEK